MQALGDRTPPSLHREGVGSPLCADPKEMNQPYTIPNWETDHNEQKSTTKNLAIVLR